MAALRPSVFIGSSSEGLAVAKALQLLLDHSADIELWSQGTFGLSGGTLESLVSALHRFDFAVLVVDADDTAVTRGSSKAVPRDNVVFEFGLFMGALGRERTFMVYDRTRPPDLPSDLAGVTAATYAPYASGNYQAALGAASTRVELEIQRLGVREARRRKDTSGAVVAGENTFSRIYELVDVYQRYSLSIESPEHMDMEYRRHQIIRGNMASGLSSQALIWTKPTDKLPPFDSTNPPAIKLTSARRTGPGSATLSAPRRQSASSFTIDLKFDSHLRVGETIDYSVEGRFPKFRFSKAAALREATRDSPVGERDFDYLSWRVNFPTRTLNFVVDLPADIGIEALGPRSSFHNDDFPAVSAPSDVLNEEYVCTTVTEVGSQFIRMHLRVVWNPRCVAVTDWLGSCHRSRAALGWHSMLRTQ